MECAYKYYIGMYRLHLLQKNIEKIFGGYSVQNVYMIIILKALSLKQKKGCRTTIIFIRSSFIVHQTQQGS